jgi:hypothetical protein
MSKNDQKPLLTLPVYVPGSERHSADYEATLQAIIDGPLSKVEPLNGSLQSLIRSVEKAETRGWGNTAFGDAPMSTSNNDEGYPSKMEEIHRRKSGDKVSSMESEKTPSEPSTSSENGPSLTIRELALLQATGESSIEEANAQALNLG